ncbi:threonylcarbamoyladenosine tRNA methylthiotransferase MtaB [Candidatus Magnetomoraceae bacterium gMMP-1]
MNITILTFKIYTLGCKVNQYESDSIAEALEKQGMSKASNKADIYIINTCTVTQKASMQSRQAVRRCIRTNPDACIVVTGCYAQTGQEEIKKIPGIHYIIGNAKKHEIPEILCSRNGLNRIPAEQPVILCPDIAKQSLFCLMPVTSHGNKTRPFLKIQDGCNAFCTYCIVPYTRGRSRSMPLDIVINQIDNLQKAGYHEVVLSGIHLGIYGSDLFPKTSLLHLLKKIENKTKISRVRLSSIEPREISNEIINLMASSEKICPHFHIPLQTGDDYLLKRVNRHYTRDFFKKLILRIKKIMPMAAIGVDTLIGLPGETDNAFENTYNLIQELDISYLHVFPFSPRKGTPAAEQPDMIPSKIIKKRCKTMRLLGEKKRRAFYKKMIKQRVEVLIEGKKDKATGLLKGFTPNYVPVLLNGNDELMHKIVRVKIMEASYENAVLGVMLTSNGHHFLLG